MAKLNLLEDKLEAQATTSNKILTTVRNGVSNV